MRRLKQEQSIELFKITRILKLNLNQEKELMSH